MGSIPGSGRSPGNGNPLQYSCLGSPMDREIGGLQSMGLQRSDTATKQQAFYIYHHYYFLYKTIMTDGSCASTPLDYKL